MFDKEELIEALIGLVLGVIGTAAGVGVLWFAVKIIKSAWVG